MKDYKESIWRTVCSASRWIRSSQKNGWIYLYYSPPETHQDKNGQKAGREHSFPLHLKEDKLDMASEKVMLRVATQREECCHAGGSLAFDAKGNLYLSTGDNTNPFGSDGFSPTDERPGRSPWDAQKSPANANDLRGKVLRVTPQADGTIKIPKGNLFKPGTPGTRPEIYAMGCRNPFRISVDQKNGILYWGDVGPDAQGFQEGRGPAGQDEVNQARAAGNFGWPYFVGDNKAYWKYDFEKKTSGERFDPLKPLNKSPNNTGIKELPPAQPAFIYYPYGPSAKFPVVEGGGGAPPWPGRSIISIPNSNRNTNYHVNSIIPFSFTNGRAIGSSPCIWMRRKTSPKWSGSVPT